MKLLAWLVLALASAVFAAPVKFSDSLHAKFHHDRCLECHQFNNPKRDGRAFSSHRSRYLCSQCHTSAVTGMGVGGWFAPDAKLDYSGMSAKATCQVVKRNMGNDDKKMLEHLLTDVRVRWAIDSGMTPGGQKERVPGGYAEWERDVRAWFKDGMRCE